MCVEERDPDSQLRSRILSFACARSPKICPYTQADLSMGSLCSDQFVPRQSALYNLQIPARRLGLSRPSHSRFLQPPGSAQLRRYLGLVRHHNPSACSIELLWADLSKLGVCISPTNNFEAS